MTGNSGPGAVRGGKRRAWALGVVVPTSINKYRTRYIELGRDNLRSHFVFRPRHAPERLRARFLPVIFLANEGELTGKTFTTSLNTTNPNTYMNFIFLRTSPVSQCILPVAVHNVCTVPCKLPVFDKCHIHTERSVNVPGLRRVRKTSGLFLTRRAENVHWCKRWFMCHLSHYRITAGYGPHGGTSVHFILHIFGVIAALVAPVDLFSAMAWRGGWSRSTLRLSSLKNVMYNESRLISSEASRRACTSTTHDRICSVSFLVFRMITIFQSVFDGSSETV